MSTTVVTQAAFSTARPSGHKCVRVQAQARHTDRESQDTPNRRAALLAGATILTTQLLSDKRALAGDAVVQKTKLNVNNLNSFQRNSERAAFLKLVEGELKKELTAGDASDTLRLVLHDAATFDVESGTGGMNGSVVLSEELSRPENASLKPIVDKLKKVKAAIDEQGVKTGYGAISWADLEVVAAKVANETEWRLIKVRGGVPSSGDIISSAFGAAWPVRLGRIDTDKPDPANRLPQNDASVSDVTEFFAKLDNRSYGATGFFAPKPPFGERQVFLLWGSSQADVKAAEANLAADPMFKYKEWKRKYDRSRETVTRTDFEVDFIDYFNQLASLGAKFDPDAYLVPIEIDVPKL